jgi:uncharacterized membrane protein
MKAIKIILAFISFLVITFFVTGLLVKETTYTSEISINKPLNEVFATFNDVSLMKNWRPDLKSIEVLTENPEKMGSSHLLIVDNRGSEVRITEKVMAYVPNEKLTLFYDAQNMLKTDEYIFSENQGMSTIKMTSSCRSDSYMMACVFPYFKGTFKEIDQTYLNNFKTYLENE